MFGVDILIGNNLPLYREALESTIRALSPDLRVRSVSEVELDAAVLRDRPWMVICSLVSDAVSAWSPSWILLFPDDRDEAIVSIGGVRQTIPHAGIHQLIELMQTARPDPGIHPIG